MRSIGWWQRSRELEGQVAIWMLFLAMTIGGFGYAIHQLAFAWHESAPTEISCADYVAKRPSVQWLRLTGCKVAGIIRWKQPSSSLVIGMRPVGSQGPLPIFVVRDDPAAQNIADAPEPFRRSEWPPMKAELERGIEGMVGALRSGLVEPLAKDHVAPAADAIQIEAGRHPLIGFSIAMLVVGGIGLLGVLILGWPLVGRIRRIRQRYREKRDFPDAVIAVRGARTSGRRRG